MNRLKGFFNVRKQFIKDFLEDTKDDSSSPISLRSSILTRYCDYYLTGLNHRDLHETLMSKNWEEVDHVVKTYDLDPEGLIDTYYYSGFLYYHEKYGYIIEHLLKYHPYSMRDDPQLECSYNPVSKELAKVRFEKAVEEQAQIIKKDIERQKALLYEGKVL